MSLTRLEGPAAEVITAADVLRHLRILDPEEETAVADYVAAAVSHLDGPRGHLGRCLINQVWEEGFAKWSSPLPLSLPDASDVAGSYLDTAGEEQTVDPADYQLVEYPRGPRINFRASFAAPALSADDREPVTVIYTAGFGAAAADVPPAIVQAARLLAGHFYQNREAVTAGAMEELPLGVRTLCAPYRRSVI